MAVGCGERGPCRPLNATADRDFDSWQRDALSPLPRPEFLAIGSGGGKLVAHADGIGSFNALSLVLELQEDGV